MNRCFCLMLVAVVLPAFVGCGDSETQPTSSTGSSSGVSQMQSSTPVTASGNPSSITQVVKDFWEAVRTGKDANALLTPAAQKCIADNDYEFAPPASENARYKIGKAELIEADKAIVESVWTDVDGDGKAQDNFITVALKLVGGNWRVSGMAADMGPDQPPFVMNLEDPAEFYGPQTVSSPKESTQPSSEGRQTATNPFEQPAVR